MEQDSDAEDTLEQDFENLCLDLNMDVKSKETAWSNVLKIQENYTLEVGHKLTTSEPAQLPLARSARPPLTG